jgi:hypothetical protein
MFRLRMSVIKTGLKRINTAYSRIHFKDICAKLKLPSPEDAEYIVAKVRFNKIFSSPPQTICSFLCDHFNPYQPLLIMQRFDSQFHNLILILNLNVF